MTGPDDGFDSGVSGVLVRATCCTLQLCMDGLAMEKKKPDLKGYKKPPIISHSQYRGDTAKWLIQLSAFKLYN